MNDLRPAVMVIFTAIYTSDIARSFSSCSSASVAFIFSFENASAFRPPTIDHCPSLHVHGKEYMRPVVKVNIAVVEIEMMPVQLWRSCQLSSLNVWSWTWRLRAAAGSSSSSYWRAQDDENEKKLLNASDIHISFLK